MKNEESLQPIDLEKFTGTVSMFGYELIRDSLLPNLLGKEIHEILYWAGKELARQYPVADFDDLALFFKKACFGDLVLVKEKKHQKMFTITGPTVTTRIQNGNPNFSLEAGFLAEQMQMQQELYAEAIAEINPRTNIVTLILQWDAKDAVSVDQPIETVTLSDEFLSNEELETEFAEQPLPIKKTVMEEEELAASVEPVEEIEEVFEDTTAPFEDAVEKELIEEVPAVELEPENEEEIEEDVFISLVNEPSSEEMPTSSVDENLTENFINEPSLIEEVDTTTEANLEETKAFESLTAEEALHEFDALSQAFNDIHHEEVLAEEEESIFDTLPSRSSRHGKKKEK